MSTLAITPTRPTADPIEPTDSPFDDLPVLIHDSNLSRLLIRDRRANGQDRRDEVWEGVYCMSPMAGDDHQRIVVRFCTILELIVGIPGLGEVRPGVNVSDRDEDWLSNYRIPDVAVRLNTGRALIRESHWFGGPDFLVEVLSPGDRARDKLDFYAAIGAREVLFVDRRPWSLELYRLQDGRLIPVGVSRPENGTLLTSDVVPLTFRLVDAAPHPRIEVRHTADEHHWQF